MEVVLNDEEILDVLDKMEDVRQRAAEKPKEYPADYVARLLTAMVAEKFGYESRADWTQRLKECDSCYNTRLRDGTFHI